MSLLNEKVSTVIQTEDLVLSNAYNAIANGVQSLRGYTVVAGYAEPREPGQYLFKDLLTQEPIIMPANTVPVYILLVPLSEMDEGGNEFKFNLYSDPQFSSTWVLWYIPPPPGDPRGVFTGSELNSKCLVPVAAGPGDGYAYFTDYTPYPYLGFEFTGNPITAGSFVAYAYCAKVV